MITSPYAYHQGFNYGFDFTGIPCFSKTEGLVTKQLSQEFWKVARVSF